MSDNLLVCRREFPFHFTFSFTLLPPFSLFLPPPLLSLNTQTHSALLVTHAASFTSTQNRFPLLIDPQGQGLAWLLKLERRRLPPSCATTPLSHPRLQERLEYCMSQGLALILTCADGPTLHPLLTPVLERRTETRAKSTYIRIGGGGGGGGGGRLCEFDPIGFNAYLTTRLPNPTFAPEVQARVSVVDFT